MAFRSIQTEMVNYIGHNRDKGEAYYARPTGNGPFPGVVVIHHMPGWEGVMEMREIAGSQTRAL